MRLVAFFLGALLMGLWAEAEPVPRRRALLIGINDYSASRLGPRPRVVPPDRDWDNLSGAVTDVGLMQEMLVRVYGFDRAGILTLTDQHATRAAILQAVEQHLVRSSTKGDTLFFYYAGHGSQVRNSLSDEKDHLDESIVPADSRLGAKDIRDKELRPSFNRILGRGAQLTILMDSCHSGSGARGLTTGERPRGIRLDPRDAADGTNYGPRPDDRGALVLAAAQDFDDAWEMRDQDGRMHGAFSWAWIRAMRDSSTGESAADTFARAAARMRAEKPYQTPVMAGMPQARFRPFLGARTDRPDGRAVVAVKEVRKDGTVLLHGGWANGLAVDSELRTLDGYSTTRVVVTSIDGLANSEGRVTAGRTLPQSVRAGALMEIVGWTPSPGRPLRVWMPRLAGDIDALAARLSSEAGRRGLRWISDPVDATPAYLLRFGNQRWELIGPGRRVEQFAEPVAAMARIPSGRSLFVQLPAAATLEIKDVEQAKSAEDSDYILTGRYTNKQLSYAWLRPNARSTDRRLSGLPVRTAWVNDPVALREAAVRLRRIHAWLLLEAPPQSPYPYRLALRRGRDGELAKDILLGGERYDLLLRAAGPLPARMPQRYVYVFMIDGDGNGILLYPGGGTGSVENRYPTLPPPPLIALADDAALEVTPPYGVDTYFLLTTDEALPDPWILHWDGVRGGDPSAAKTPLERLIALTGSTSRSARIATPSNWSLGKLVFESVAPRAKK